jgi:hypothetical protein
MTKEEEEQSPPRTLLDRDGDERGDRTRQAADGGEERAKDDSGIAERRAAASERRFQHFALTLVCAIRR